MLVVQVKRPAVVVGYSFGASLRVHVLMQLKRPAVVFGSSLHCHRLALHHHHLAEA